MNPHTEISSRLHILNHLKVTDKEFKKHYFELSRQNLSDIENEKTPLDIDLDKIAC